MPVPRAGAGMCARRRTFFSCVAKKRRQKKATPSLRPLRYATGQTCSGAVAGCAVELALLLRSAARTATASQITKHARSDARATPQPPRRRRSHRGWTAENSRTATRVFAALDPVCAARGACARETGPSEAMARVDVGRVPFWMRLGRAASSAVQPAAEHRRLPRSAAKGSQTAGSPFLW